MTACVTKVGPAKRDLCRPRHVARVFLALWSCRRCPNSLHVKGFRLESHGTPGGASGRATPLRWQMSLGVEVRCQTLNGCLRGDQARGEQIPNGFGRSRCPRSFPSTRFAGYR